jgi:hypothetical protein
VLNGTVNNPTVPSGHTIKINGEPITFSGVGNIALSTIVLQINATTSNHNVVASSFVTPTTIVSNSAGTAYGLTGGYAPFSAYINSGSGNTLVNFTTTGSQYTNVATPEDMAADINSANIANLTASATATVSAPADDAALLTCIRGKNFVNAAEEHVQLHQHLQQDL